MNNIEEKNFDDSEGKIIFSEGLKNTLLPKEGQGIFTETEHQLLKRTCSATLAQQRLAWLEETLELAHQAGALRSKTPKERSEAEGSGKK